MKNMKKEIEISWDELINYQIEDSSKYGYQIAPENIPDIKPKEIWEQLQKKYLEGGHHVEKKISSIQAALRGYGVREKKTYFFKQGDLEDSLPLLYGIYLNGKESLPLCQDEKLLLELKTALQKGEWNNKIFDHQSASDIARTLFKNGAINVQQFISVLEWVALKKDFDIEDIFPVLDEENQFSEDALYYLCRGLLELSIKNSFIGALSEFQLDYLRQLVAELPLSEQRFYLVKPKENIANHSLFETLKVKLNSFPDAFKKSDHTLFWPRGMHDAILRTKYGERYRPSMPRHGRIGIYALEEANARGERLSSIEYGDGKKIDGHLNCTDFLSIVHDYYHEHRFCALHPSIHKGLDRVSQFVRKGTGVSLSSEIWKSIDRDFNFFVEAVCNSENFYTVLKEIKKGSNSNIFISAFFIELQQNKQYWNDLGITEEALLSNNDYLVFKKYYPNFAKDDFKTQCFKYEKAKNLTRFKIDEEDIEYTLQNFKAPLVIKKDKETQNRIEIREDEPKSSFLKI